MQNELQATLLRLRNEFIANLPERVAALEYHLNALTRGAPESQELLHRAAHNMAGSAGTHGLMQLSDAAREFEEIMTALSPGVKTSEAQLQAMRAALTAIARLAANPSENLVPQSSRRATSARIMVVEDDAEQSGWLRHVLEYEGYQVDVFSELATFRAAMQANELPAAIIMDMVFPEGDEAGARAILDINADSSTTIPVIFLSVRQDMLARLSAHRAGATRYMVKPVDRAALLREIADSTALTPIRPYRVLMVDDDQSQLAVNSHILRCAGMEVHETHSPLEVLDILNTFQAEVLLLDMHMPECSGAELAAVLQDDDRFSQTPIIYLSGDTDISQQLRALDHGGEHFLVKPVNHIHLVTAVSMHARRYRQATEHTEALRTARYERERQQQALNTHAIVSMTDTTGNIISVNDNFCRVSGYARDELLGHNHRIVKSGEHPAEFYVDMWHTISGGKIWHGEICNRAKDGHLYWVKTTIVPFLDANGLPYQYVSMRTDISRLKLVMQQTVESETRLNQAQRIAHLGSFDWNVISKELKWSDEHYRLWGLEPQSVTASYELFRAGIHPDDVARVDDVLQRALAGGGSYDCQHRVARPDGHEYHIHGLAEVIFDETGQPVRMIGTVQDITERIQTEHALSDSRMRLEEAQAQAHLGSWDSDLTTGKATWSEETFRIYGLDSGNFMPSPKSFFSAVHPDDMAIVLQNGSQAAKTGVFDFVHRIIRPNGEVRYVHELAKCQVDSCGQLTSLSGTVQDVTDLKKTEQELIKARDTAESASRAKSEFLSSMSHELRTPLNAILGFSQLFTMDSDLPQETRDNAREIERAGQHLLSLINDMIDLARIEAGRLGLSIEPVQIDLVMRNCLSMVESLARDKNILLIENNCTDQHFTVTADHVRLRQVLINLISNAIKYNRPQGTVTLSCLRRDDYLRINVTDTGAGIPADKQARIFNAFDRLGEERGTIEGTGIGLVITKRIVEAMGGMIGFASTAGVGSEFWVEFPLTAESGIDTVLPETETGYPAPLNHHAHRPVVLYIEDNPMNLRLMQQVFGRRKNVELRHAETGEIGVSLSRDNPPDLILMDLNLPGMDGYAALKLLKADVRTASIPVIAVTANAMMGDEERGLASGFSDYLTKPMKMGALYALLDKQFPPDPKINPRPATNPQINKYNQKVT